MAPGRKRVFSFKSNAPLSLTTIIPMPNEENGSTSKKVRGLTKGKGLQKIVDAVGKLPIQISKEMGRPLDALQSAKLTSEIGVIARNIAPLRTKWKDMTDDDKIRGYERLREKFVINLEDSFVKKSCKEILKRSSRVQRYKLKQKFEQYGSVEDAKKHKPERVNQEEWDALCDMWSNPNHQDRCLINKANRSKLKNHHTTGSRPYVVVHNEMCSKRKHVEGQILDYEEAEIEGEENDDAEYDAIELFKEIHYKVDKGWLGTETESDYNKMLEKKHQPILEGESSIDPIQIVLDVLGAESSYVQSIGYATKTSKKKIIKEYVDGVGETD